MEALRQRLQAVRKACAAIGQAPGRPPGIRAAIGALPVALMGRLMFWYAPHVQFAIGALTDVVDDALRDLDAAILRDSVRLDAVEALQQDLLTMIRMDAGRIAAIENRLRELDGIIGQEHTFAEQHTRSVAEALERARAQLENQVLETAQQDRSRAAHLEVRINEQERALELERATTIGIEGDVREQGEAMQQMEEERRQGERRTEERMREAGERVQLLRRETLDLGQRLARIAVPVEVPPKAAAAEDAAALDAVGAALESASRGTRGEAQARWKEYLPLMPREGPVLDVGCGRGEWLELLRLEGIAAHGVEANRLLAAECGERLLAVTQADPLDYLARTPDDSLAAVTVLRIVEQLSFGELVRLVDEVARVLRPGGMALFETPNPDNLLAGGRDFYKDPGRRHPIPCETLSALVKARGLAVVEVRMRHPAGEEERVPEEADSAVARRFNRCFYGPRDYALVCRKIGRAEI